MAQTSTDDFMDDLKDYFQALLVSSFTFGSVFPLAFRTASDLIPTYDSSTNPEVRLFYVVNAVYFIGPLILGFLGWVWLYKNDADDLVFKDEILSPRQAQALPRFPKISVWIWLLLLLLLIGSGLFLMYPRGGYYHGSDFIRLLLVLHILITVSVVALSVVFYKTFISKRLTRIHNRKLVYFNPFFGRICILWGLGLLATTALYILATLSFFNEHEGKPLWDVSNQKGIHKDSLLHIDMPFRWEKTAKEIDNSLISPLSECFTAISTEATLLDATLLDYNDIGIRVRPSTIQQQLLNPTLPLKPADSLQHLILVAYRKVDRLTGGPELRYTNSDSLDNYLDIINESNQIPSFKRYYSLKLDSVRHAVSASDTLLTPTMQLLRANELMPLADNLSEAADLVRQRADKQSRSLLAQWIRISRIKGLFFLATFLNMLLCAWFIIRVVNEARLLLTEPAKLEDPPKAPRQYRELTNLRYFLSLTVLLIIPLFRTIDETNVSSTRPYWFLNLPELVGNVVQPLPNNDAVNNFGQNEVTNRLDQIKQQVETLNNATKRLEKVSGTTRTDLHDMKY